MKDQDGARLNPVREMISTPQTMTNGQPQQRDLQAEIKWRRI